MNNIQYTILGLLAREPLSGYEMKQQINNRITHFYKINNNQLYPSLSKLEQSGFIELQAIEQESYRPPRKIYRITPSGIDALKSWVLELPEVGDTDTFLLKQYSSWLVSPDALIELIRKKKEQHENMLKDYKERISSFQEQNPDVNHPLFSTISVIEMGINFEEAGILWCSRMHEVLKQHTLANRVDT
ncbi:PadR family transcriptional regulator [Paenibacillus motobuensis]|uniref:PadR family transcriptional regulator n=1 Tax=Paenibacillus TaxID=44249 RepID=UPI00203C1194|nr:MULTISPECIES: PadR family transcriptional regulator [Paenibacillus]MCM3039611.1 PadR family transcriptional regulator [Paenibacillus lutimineralis]MCM3646715.1 PadR family transcriptional regulator [Paenibacillus motobuensis]